jgi:hypothetical protein
MLEPQTPFEALDFDELGERCARLVRHLAWLAEVVPPDDRAHVLARLDWVFDALVAGAAISDIELVLKSPASPGLA